MCFVQCSNLVSLSPISLLEPRRKFKVYFLHSLSVTPFFVRFFRSRFTVRSVLHSRVVVLCPHFLAI